MKRFVAIYLFICILTGAFALAAYERLEAPLLGVEDANIYFVYAKNLVEGHGFVYNVGGERVEGFTSLLWTLICAVTIGLSSNFEIVLLIVSIALVSLGLTLTVTFIRDEFSTTGRAGAGWFWPSAFLALVYLMPQYVAWSTITLMEAGLWSSLLLVTVIGILKADQRSVRYTNVVLSMLMIALIASRPEAMLWGAAFVLSLFVLRVSRMGVRGALRSTSAPFVAYAAALAALVVFRVFYFGYPLPNTYYAKVSPLVWFNISDGAKYFSRYYDGSTVVKIAVLSVFLGVADAIYRMWNNRESMNALMLLPVFGLVGIVAPILTGGDHVVSFRFYQIVFPILALNLLYFVRFVLSRYIGVGWKTDAARICKVTLISVVVIATVWAQVGHWRDLKEESALHLEVGYARDGQNRGRHMADLFSAMEEYPSVATAAAGGQKFTYPGEIVDMMGLNNVRMAHNGGMRKGIKNHAAFEKHTFYELNPDVVWPTLARESTWKYNSDYVARSFANVIFKGLFFEPKFQNDYVFAKIGPKKKGDDTVLLAFVAKDYLERLEENGNIKVETYTFKERK